MPDTHRVTITVDFETKEEADAFDLEVLALVRKHNGDAMGGAREYDDPKTGEFIVETW